MFCLIGCPACFYGNSVALFCKTKKSFGSRYVCTKLRCQKQLCLYAFFRLQITRFIFEVSSFIVIDGKLGKALFSIPAKNYHSGSISLEIHVDEPGEYVLHLSGVDENQLDFRLVIPITVGSRWYEGIVQFWPLLLLCAAAVSFYNFRRIID